MWCLTLLKASPPWAAPPAQILPAWTEPFPEPGPYVFTCSQQDYCVQSAAREASVKQTFLWAALGAQTDSWLQLWARSSLSEQVTSNWRQVKRQKVTTGGNKGVIFNSQHYNYSLSQRECSDAADRNPAANYILASTWPRLCVETETCWGLCFSWAASAHTQETHSHISFSILSDVCR